MAAGQKRGSESKIPWSEPGALEGDDLEALSKFWGALRNGNLSIREACALAFGSETRYRKVVPQLFRAAVETGIGELTLWAPGALAECLAQRFGVTAQVIEADTTRRGGERCSPVWQRWRF
ncbi:MAG: hypothetical protein ACE5HV_17865 [Acidobacteriota bacterium]